LNKKPSALGLAAKGPEEKKAFMVPPASKMPTVGNQNIRPPTLA
jgi:hypothetical protein